jgi:hypothetical protein
MSLKDLVTVRNFDVVAVVTQTVVSVAVVDIVNHLSSMSSLNIV